MFTVDNIFTDRLSINDIESQVNQEDIFLKYCPHFKKVDKDFKSEFYDDNKPDCRIYKNNLGKLIYHDFGCPEHHMNCYTYIMKKYSCNFSECLRIIANDFNLIKYDNTLEFKPNFIIGNESYIHKTVEPKVKTTIEIVSRNWTLTDYNYWFKQYGITFEWLMSYDIKPLDSYYITKNGKTYYFKCLKSDPTYHYNLNGISKVYKPYNIGCKWMFFGSGLIIEGYQQLPDKGDLLIITKSLKDVIQYAVLGYNAISFNSETVNIPEYIIDELKSRFTTIIIQLDNDETGINSAFKLSLKYALKSIIIPSKYKCKDLTDLVVKIGLNEAKTVLKRLLQEFI